MVEAERAKEARYAARGGASSSARLAELGVTESPAERYIDSLELFGMQFGLERMHALLAGWAIPRREFDAIHVVGTNGKSSTARFCEALLVAEGVRTGAYTVAPHHHLQRADPGRRRDDRRRRLRAGGARGA